jgi:hypothetical protein
LKNCGKGENIQGNPFDNESPVSDQQGYPLNEIKAPIFDQGFKKNSLDSPNRKEWAQSR